MKLADFGKLLKNTVKKWIDDDVPRLGASLAFYTLLSVAPLLVVVTALAGLIFGEQAARGELFGQIKGMVGPQAAEAIQTMLANAHQPAIGTLASVLSLVVLLVGATGVFSELQSALNTIWGVTAKEGSGLLSTIKDRLLTFVMVLLIGILLMASVVASAVLSALSKFAGGHWPHLAPALHLANLGASLVIFTVLFALIYKVLPDAKISWSDVWIGSAVTAVLFTLGKYLIGLYLGIGSVGSPYGAAGSLAVFLIWVYYSAQVLFLGAEFTQMYANRFGSCIQPTANAQLKNKEACARQP